MGLSIILFILLGSALFLWRISVKKPAIWNMEEVHQKRTKLAAKICSATAVAIVLLFSFTIVHSGKVKVPKLFGKYQKTYIPEGIHFVNPFYSLKEISIQRQHFEVNDGDSVAGTSCTTADQIDIDTRGNYAYEINPEYAWWILREIGDEEKLVSSLLMPTAMSSARDASASYSLQEAQIGKRGEYEHKLMTEFQKNTIDALPAGKGLSDLEIREAVRIFPVQLMGVRPNDKVANSLNEKKAAEIDLSRQVTLTAIAAEQANRLQNQGMGVKNMFDELPKDISAKDMAMVIGSLADYKRSEAMLKAVENGDIKSMVFEGSAARVPQ